MKTVKLDKEAIKEAMWDGCNGSHVLAVAPDGSDHRIHWMEDNRQWDPWPDDWLTIGIPALDPDGSGQASEDALERLQELRLMEKAEELMEAKDIGSVEAIERLAPDEWEADREASYDWLLDAFISACNGYGGDLNNPDPWGTTGNMYDGPIGAIKPPAEFEWA